MKKDLRFDLGGGAELRAFTPNDMKDLYAVVDAERDRLREWLPWVDLVKSVEDERRWLELVTASEGNLDGNGIFADGRFAGGCGMRVDPYGVSAEIGYWLSAAFEGRGLVTRSCRALIGLAFGELGVHRLMVRAGAENLRSRAVPERLGFTQEGIHREEGSGGRGFHDLVVYGLLDREWPAGS